ncbi:hypothetical protein GH714_013911 [Hevea brasiliensis]|uniref:Uncharacterized protein n=1 Tax=Hevea brasiliensis TaxID=3981 RepID=A0A6A6N3K7_HEVBR|nr:hypothetical protein GH714_013911 [Hevea brasiliensis]
MSICICSSASSQPSLNLSVIKNPFSPTISFSIVAYFNLPISLWTSKPINTNRKSFKLLDNDTVSSLLINLVEDVLSYCSNKCKSSIQVPKLLDSVSNIKDIFNLVFFTLSFVICIYEAPADLRSKCLDNLKTQLTNSQLREALKLFMKTIGSNLEEQWTRSVNLAITNWIPELQATSTTLKTPSPLFSYSLSTFELWKVQLYCPIISMDIESSSNSSADERLLFSLKHHQLEGVIQFNYKVIIQEKWVDVIVVIDNIRCDIVRLVNDTLMKEQGVGIEEKHFPSRISLHLTPILQTNIISVSVSKSSDNPTTEIEVGKSIETSFDPPNSFLGLKLAVGETISTSLKPWKFEESVHGYSSILNWFLHDSMDGREVSSSKPSKMALINPKAWFKHRYSNAHRPFNRQGGVVFAKDEYGNGIRWKVDKSSMGKTMEWEIKGFIWLTYWPNNYITFHSETRRLEFREILHLTIA